MWRSILLLAVGAQAAQWAIHQGPSGIELSALSTNEYTTLTHPAHAGHSVRIKRTTEFCDPTVKAYTGYLDIAYNAKHLFFYFFESRNDPQNDDVVMWINGGPGCSSGVGLLMELGPCNIDMSKNQTGNGTLWNPHSWNNRANIFFLDQPVGVGFSYADYGETVETTEDAAKDIHAFVSLFFGTFSSFKGRAFHLSGESYGGRYLPVFASEIYDQNRLAELQDREPINLQSVIIGNGATDFVAYFTTRYDIVCGTAALDKPILDIPACVRAKLARPRCETQMKKECLDRFDAIGCGVAVEFCDAEMSAPFRATGRNVYDVSKPCIGSLCYAETGAIEEYLNRPDIRALVGAESPGNYSGCSDAVGDAFDRHLDKYSIPTKYYVAELLERGVKVLIYAGTYDFQCNWVGNHKWTSELEWSGHDAFSSQPLRDWYTTNSTVPAGQTRSANGLTFLTILGAGHMVPHDKPVEALTMLNRWLAQDKF